MRYINKEYGFAFRPPFNEKFFEEKKTGPALTAENYPGKYSQGVGYDYGAINGAMLIGKFGSMWGVKVCFYNGKKWLDNDDFVNNLSSSCANTADGSFAHFASGPLSVKWVRHNDQSLLMQVSARKKLRVRVIFYPCFSQSAELSIDGASVQGRSPYLGVVAGQISLADNNAVFKDRYLAVGDDEPEREYFVAQSFNKPSDSANGAFNEAIMEFVINRNQPSVYLYAAVGDDKIFSAELPRTDKIVSHFESAELRYGVNKTMGTGVLGAPAERMLNSVLWSRVYYPYLFTELYSPRRSVLNNHFDLSGTEENCNAILGSMTGVDKAVGQLKYLLEDKILAPLAVWHVFAHTSEKSDILYLYKKLTKLYPADSKPVVSEPDKNEIAYKWVDSPLKERYNASAMYSLDMTSLKLLALDILERICVLFDLPEGRRYKKAKDDLIQFLNDTLWNESEGLYMGRYVTGQWVGRTNVGPSSFYPLLAGAVDTPEKLTALVENLTDPAKFWAEYPVPTLAVFNREYGKRGRPNNNGHRKPPYLEYRGSVVPYVNYILYHGLRRYGLDEIAGLLATKSARLWSNNENDNVENYSVYLPGGKRCKAKEYLSSNGNMLALLGIQELIDLEYFRGDLRTQALRFGTFTEGDNSLTNLKMLGRSFSIDVNDTETMLIIDNVNVFRGSGGKFVVRNFLETPSGCEFLIDAHAAINVNLCVPAGGKKNLVRYSFSVPTGKSKVAAENGTAQVLPVLPVGQEKKPG